MENQNLTRKKRKFTRYKSVNQVKLKGGWRRVRGMHNKVRLKKKGHIHKVSIGYGTKKETRNLYNSMHDYKLINNLNDLNNIDKKYILISRLIGLKKRLEILKKAKGLGLRIIRVKDIDVLLKKIEEKLNDKRKNKENKQKKKEIYQKKAEEKSKDKKETKGENPEKEKEDKKKVLEGKQ